MQIPPISSSQFGFCANIRDVQSLARSASCHYDKVFYAEFYKRFNNVEKEMFKKNINKLVFDLRASKNKVPEALKRIQITESKTFEEYINNSQLKIILGKDFIKYKLPNPSQIDLTAKASLDGILSRIFSFFRVDNMCGSKTMPKLTKV